MAQIPAAAFSLLYETDLKLTQKAFDKVTSGEVILLGVSGKMGAGKDTTAPPLMEALGYQGNHESFARPLREELDTILGRIASVEGKREAETAITGRFSVPLVAAHAMTEYLYEEVKTGVLKSSKDRTRASRSALQYWGTEVRRKEDTDYWVKKVAAIVIAALSSGESVYVTDPRFENEIDMLHRAGGYTLRLSISEEERIRRIKLRDGLEPSRESLEHLSERALDRYESLGYFTVTLRDDQATVEEIVEIAKKAIEAERVSHSPRPLKVPDLRKTFPKEFFFSNKLEPIILAVDLDEVCFDYLGGMRKFLEEEKGYIIPPGKATSWSLMQAGWVESEAEYKQRHSEAVEKGIYTRLEVLPGTSEILHELEVNGYEINIITSRFVVPGQNELVLEQTAKALKAAHIPYANIMFQKRKALFLADAYLDDGPHNIEALREQGRFVIRMNQPHNAYLPGPAADNWFEARAILKNRFGR